ncbi:MAG: hypothetical protein QXK06_05885 [Candidatus Diapherotrites archaeon]
MQVIEVLVFFFFAVIAGFLVIGFIGGFDFQKMQENLTQLLGGKPADQNTFQKINYNAFLGMVSDCWRSCNFGREDRDCGIVHVVNAEEKDYGKPITKLSLETDFNKFNVCETCNLMVSPANLTIPSTLKVRCDKATKAIRIEG